MTTPTSTESPPEPVTLTTITTTEEGYSVNQSSEVNTTESPGPDMTTLSKNYIHVCTSANYPDTIFSLII